MLPFDISTALWWQSTPKWEWEPLPPPEGDSATAADTPAAADAPTGDGGADAAPLARTCATADTTAATTAASPATGPAAGAANAPAPKPGDEREGFHLVFKGYEIAASVFWYPADSPLSRPWTAHDATDDHRPRNDDDAGDAAARAALLRAANHDGAEPT